MALTSKEALALARKLRSASAAVGDLLDDNWDRLSPAERKDLEKQERQIFDAATKVRTDAVGLALEEASTSAEILQGLIGDAKACLEKLEDVRNAIKIATALAEIAVAVASKDLGSIAKHGKVIYDSVTG